MEPNRKYSMYVLPNILLVVVVLALSFWLKPELNAGNLFLIAITVILIALLSHFSIVFSAKIKRDSSRRIILTFLILLILIAGWVLIVRLSSYIWGTSLAWQLKWGSLVFCGSIILFEYICFYLNRKGVYELNRMGDRLSIKEMELDTMKTQLNPHFLFNSLNNVAATIMVNRDLALDYTYKLSELLRYQVGISARETVGISEEEAFIRNYLDIERLRHGDRFNIEFVSEIYTPSLQLPPFLLHPIIEQALRQSQGLNGRSSILIKLRADNALLLLAISFAKPVSPAHKQTGNLHMIEKRLKHLYPGRHSLVEIQKNGSREIELIIRF